MKLFGLLAFCLALSLPVFDCAADTISTAEVVDYVENTWEIASDGSDAITYFSGALGTNYNGIPFSDYIDCFVVGSRLGVQLDARNYYDASRTVAGFASDHAIDIALEKVGAEGLFGVATFSAAIIEFSLNCTVCTWQAHLQMIVFPVTNPV